MKLIRLHLATIILASAVLTSYATEYNLQKLADSDGLTLHNRETKTAPEELPATVYLTMAENDGLAWVKDLVFSEGTIEIDVRGANRPGQSFVGVAFHGENNDAYDAVYLRPFNFRNPNRKDHALQYISMPNHDWSALRNSHPGKYESSLTPAPAPEDWVHLQLSIEGDQLKVYINNSHTPELEAQILNQRRDGSVGLWVGNGSDGEFRNLTVSNIESPDASSGI